MLKSKQRWNCLRDFSPPSCGCKTSSLCTHSLLPCFRGCSAFWSCDSVPLSIAPAAGGGCSLQLQIMGPRVSGESKTVFDASELMGGKQSPATFSFAVCPRYQRNCCPSALLPSSLLRWLGELEQIVKRPWSVVGWMFIWCYLLYQGM